MVVDDSKPGAGAGSERFDVAIIGTGFAGIAMAHSLKRIGLSNFVIFEKASSVGGTWRDNNYPGARCDVPSVLYSLSFAPKADWTCTYPPQPEIQQYLAATAKRLGIERQIRFGVEIVELAFDTSEGIWRLTDADGKVVEARFAVSAVGQLSRPAIPNAPGRELFRGAQFHTARWRHDYDLKDKVVAVVGTGASAIQVVPAIAPRVKKLILFQRSPAWVFPKVERPTTALERAVYRFVPGVQKYLRLKTFLRFERGFDKYIADTPTNRELWQVGRRLIDAQISDRELRKKVTPDYTPGCKRILLSNEWYSTLARENVTVVCSGVKAFNRNAVVDEAGDSHEVDAVVYATGFKSTEFLMPMKVKGLDGADLQTVWAGEPEAYRGVAMPGFPNLFFMYGPNTNTHNSIIFMLETQARYIAGKVKWMARSPGAFLNLEVRALRDYYAELQPRFGKFSWAGNCHNWYRTASGRVVNNWPARSRVYAKLMAAPDRHNYAVQPVEQKSAPDERKIVPRRIEKVST